MGAIKENIKPTSKGYIRYKRVAISGNKHKMEHVVVWEKHFGKVPDGMQIHHIDGNKLNNDISNLQLVTPLEHKRIHEGCKLINGIWYKPCSCCGKYKPMDKENWYFSRGWINGRLCKVCYTEKSLQTRKTLIARGWKRYKPKANRNEDN